MRCRPSNREDSFICIHSAAAAAAAAAPAAALSAVILLLLLQQLLLFVVVCRMAKVVAGSSNLIPVFSFSSFNAIYFLCTPWKYGVALRSRFAYILGNYRHARNQGGRQPAAAKLLIICANVFFFAILAFF